MLADAVLALEVWMLVSMLAAWFFCRCALGLRGQQAGLGELRLERAQLEPIVPRLEAPQEQDSLMRAVRVFDRA